MQTLKRPQNISENSICSAGIKTRKGPYYFPREGYFIGYKDISHPSLGARLFGKLL